VTVYELLLFGHIICAVAWVGSSIGMQLQSTRALRRGQDRVAEFMDDVEWLGNRLQGPSAMLVILFGILLVLKGQWGFGRLWIILAIIAVAVSFVIAAFYLMPETKRVAQLVRSQGATDATTQARLRRVMLVSRVELLILVVVIFLMAVKPGS
jgi:uncharacterized membrane protein